MAEGIESGVMGQCQEKLGVERDIGGQHIPPNGRLGQGALTAPGGLWQAQKCTFLVAMSVHEKS